MVVNIEAEVNKIYSTIKSINGITMALGSDLNISEAIKAMHTVVSSAFIDDMTRVATTNPQAFGHMYEWGRAGDPTARLWKHTLKGHGKDRAGIFEFKASKTAVPVAPQLEQVGVKKRHIFYWKAPIMEYGLPVQISPKLAKVLVYLNKPSKNSSSTGFSGWVRNGIVYRKTPVSLDRAGNKTMWNSFTNQFVSWHSSDEPTKAINMEIAKNVKNSIFRTMRTALAEIQKQGGSKRQVTINPMAADPSIAKKLQDALQKDYTAAARNRSIS